MTTTEQLKIMHDMLHAARRRAAKRRLHRVLQKLLRLVVRT